MFNKTTKKIAPNSLYESFIMKLQLLTKDEIDEFVRSARSQNIPENQIQQGLKLIESLKSHS